METVSRQEEKSQSQVGQGWKRVEDQRLLTGKGHYIDDLEPLADIAHAAILRSTEAHAHGLQYGFCTPGFLMPALELLEEKQDLSEGEIREAISGNLCRCTGYQGIVEAIRAADQTWERAVASRWKGEE